jgi:hypothetical protein
MSMLRTCREPGCTTRTLGERCIDHERQPGTRLTAATRRPSTAASAARQAGKARASGIAP